MGIEKCVGERLTFENKMGSGLLLTLARRSEFYFKPL